MRLCSCDASDLCFGPTPTTCTWFDPARSVPLISRSLTGSLPNSWSKFPSPPPLPCWQRQPQLGVGSGRRGVLFEGVLNLPWSSTMVSLFLFFFLKIYTFFDLGHFKSLYWTCYSIASVVYDLGFWPWGMWNLRSPTRDQTLTSCIGRWSLHHWTTREAPTFESFCWTPSLPAHSELTSPWDDQARPLQRTRSLRAYCSLSFQAKEGCCEFACVHTKSLQLCPTLCDPMGPSSPGSSRFPCPPPGDLPNPWIKPVSLKSPVLGGGFFTTSVTWKARSECTFL